MVNVVVLDTCEDRNDYGNNYQWCVAAKGVPKGGISTGTYAGHTPPFAHYLRGGEFTITSKEALWGQADCFDESGNWLCTNMAGEPLHFDFAIQELDDDRIEELGVWPKHTNPKVLASKRACFPVLALVLLTDINKNYKLQDQNRI